MGSKIRTLGQGQKRKGNCTDVKLPAKKKLCMDTNGLRKSKPKDSDMDTQKPAKRTKLTHKDTSGERIRNPAKDGERIPNSKATTKKNNRKNERGKHTRSI